MRVRLADVENVDCVAQRVSVYPSVKQKAI